MRKGCFRIFCALALVLAVSAPAALAGTISGSGWFDTDYTGSYVEVENSDTYFKLPSGWVTEEVLGYVSYRSADGSVTLNPSHFQDQNYWDYVQFVEETEGQACDESAYLILGDDMDWYVIRWGDYFIAFCPAYRGDGTVAFNFETDGSESACANMRRILSSVCY